jgi:hypothetical protein
MRKPLILAGSASPVGPLPVFVYVRSYVPPGTSMLVQQLSPLAPQLLRPAPLVWQLVPAVVSQRPPPHAPDGHVAAAAHCASGPQICQVVPLAHCVVPGLQATQTPFRHTGVLPEQAAPPYCVGSGLHSAQAPFRHTGVLPEQAAPLFRQISVASQTCGCWPSHWTAPDTQVVQRPSRHTGVLPEQAAPLLSQLPIELQTCGC